MPMLSVIVLCHAGNSVAPAEAVVRTLTPLVQAAVQGLVRDVILAGPPAGDLGLIAEHAGCGVVEAPAEAAALRQAFNLARADDVMLLRAGYVPELGFFEEVEDFLRLRTDRNLGRRLQAAPETFIERLVPRAAPCVGAITAQALCQNVPDTSFADLIRRLKLDRSFVRRLRRVG